MATSYTIYLKNVISGNSGGGGGHSPTKPTAPGRKDKTSAQKFYETFKKVKSYSSDVMKDLKNDAGVVEALGWVGVAIVAVKACYDLGTKVADVIVPIKAMKSGNYTRAINYENYKTVVNNIFHPLTTWRNVYTYDTVAGLAQARAEQEQLLTGSSLVNTYKRGV